MKNEQIHVLPDGEEWKVTAAGGDRHLGKFKTKEAAVAQAREFSRKEQAELIIHDQHGRIQEKDSHGNDPYPPRG